MNRFIIPAVIFIALAGVLFVGVRKSTNKGVLTSALVGKTAPSFELPVLGDAGRKFSSAELAGKPYAINVWGTWCVECRAEHEVLLAAQREGRLPIIGLNWRDNDAEAIEWLRVLGNPYSVVVVDAEGRTAIDYGVYGAPETFFIDARGVVQHRHVGPLSAEIWQREFIARLSGAQP